MNKKPKPIKQKPLIKAAILRWLKMFRPGDTIRSEEIVKAVKRDLNIKYLYSDTVLRYLRELRHSGLVNYTCTNKQERIFKIIELNEPHSK